MNDDVRPLPKSLSELPDAPPEEYPRAFGNYVLLAPLARGGMGEVFLAKHGSVRGLEKHCVVKTLRPHLTDDREYTTRFIDEARIVVQLGHRNICHVFDVGTVGERYYLAMEYIAGKDLRALTHDVGEQGGVMNPGVALHIVCETLEALDYAHRHVDAATGKPLLLVHRDVSPQNVMLSWEGETKLIDFGLAASTLKMEQTSPNVVMGKLAYMAPEQVRGERVDGRADMFAAAVVLYEMLVGERFYEGRSPYEIWGIAAQGNFRPRKWDSLDDDMKAILEKALAGKADNRHASCIDLREALVGYKFARGLHGDAPLLRSLMHKVYAPDIEESRRTLATLTRAVVRNTDPLAAHPSGVFSVSTEPTVSLARSPSSSEPLPMGKRRNSGPVVEGTEPTEMAVKAMFGPRRAGPMAAAVAAVIVALVAVGFGASWAARRDDKKPVAVVPVDVKPVDVKPVEVKPVDDVKPVDVKPVDVKPVDVKPDEVKPVDVKKHPREKRDEAKVEVKPDVKPEVKPDVKPEVVEVKPDAVEVKPAEVKKGTRTDDVRVDELAAKCPQNKCTQKVLVHRKDYGLIPLPALRVWKADLKACEVECGIGP